jgi:ABC-type multidrug transport system permease subunit
MMRRFLCLLGNEMKLLRTTIPIHIIALIQPALMFSLMAFVLITPTFDMNVRHPVTPEGEALVAAMKQVGSPIGEAYILPVEVDWEPGEPIPKGQVVWVDQTGQSPRVTQTFSLIDSNMVKNFRNRLTSAAFLLWQERLGPTAVEVTQFPLLPRDVSYRVYFGLAMLPLAAFIGAGFVGAFLSAQEFEFKTITEYQLAPAPWLLVVTSRLVRLSITGVLSGTILAVMLFIFDGVLPSSLWLVILVLAAIGLIGASFGTCAALLLRSTLPAFVITLASAFFTWIMGGAFGLPAGFGGAYEAVSRWMPNTYAVQVLYNQYYDLSDFDTLRTLVTLLLFTAACLVAVMCLYRWVVLKRGNARR